MDRGDCVKILSIGKVVEDPTYTLCMCIFVCVHICAEAHVCVCVHVDVCVHVCV